MVYAIVRAGGRQEKVSVGDVLEIDRLQAAPGDSVELPVLLLVDGADVTSDKAALAKASVTVEVVAATKGPKINILKYKNKTGYRKRQGHPAPHAGQGHRHRDRREGREDQREGREGPPECPGNGKRGRRHRVAPQHRTAPTNPHET